MAAKAPKRHGIPWSDQEVKQLRQMVKERTPTREMAVRLERTADSVRSKAKDQGISLSAGKTQKPAKAAAKKAAPKAKGKGKKK